MTTKVEPTVEKWELLEKLAEIEHDQWIEWSSDIIHKENISKKRSDRWTRLQFTDYKALTEEEKEQDRKYARKVLDLYFHSLAEAKKEWVEEMRGKVNDMKYRGIAHSDLEARRHNALLERVEDLLTGDNPEEAQ